MDIHNFLQERFYKLLRVVAVSSVLIILTLLCLTVYYIILYGVAFIFTVIVLAITIFIYSEKYLKEREPLRKLINDEYMLDYREHRFALQNGTCATLSFATHRIDQKTRAIKIFFTTSGSAPTAGSRLGEMRPWNRKRVVQFYSVDNLDYDPVRNALYNMLHIPVNLFVPVLTVDREEGDRRFLGWSRSATAEKVVYLTLKYMDGGCMELHLNELRNRSLNEKLQYAITLTTCLEYLHKNVNKIHRNIKLSNVLHEMGVPILSDIGFVDVHARQTEIFHSPEQDNGALSVDLPSDVYSLGLILACLFTSHDAFNMVNFVRFIKKDREDIKKHEQYNILPSPARLIFNMVHDSPNMRPTSTEVKEELKRILNENT